MGAKWNLEASDLNGWDDFGDLSDTEWARIAPLLPPQRPRIGRPAHNHRTVVSGILWVQRTGGPWRHMPRRYGRWSTAASRYYRWKRSGIWERIQAALAKDVDESCGERTPSRHGHYGSKGPAR